MMVTMTLVMVIIVAMTTGYTDDAGDDFCEGGNDGDDLVIAMMVTML